MTSRYLHRRTSTAATAFPSPVQPGELVVNTANRQLVVGDAASATLGAPLPLLAVRVFDVRAQYAVGDYVVQAGALYRANAAVSPGAFNPVLWDAVTSSDVTKAYVDAADANLAASTQAGFDAQTTAMAAKADKTYVDSQNAAQNTTITGKADKSYVDAADALKADKTYVDAADALKVAKAGDTMSGALTVTPKGSLFGGVGGTVATGAVVPADANIKLYDLAGGNWAGFGVDTSGALWCRTGLSGTPAPAFWVGTDQTLNLIKDPTAALGVATKQYVDAKAPGAATAAEYIANSAPTKMLTPGAAWSAAQNIQPITPGATLTPDFSLGFDHYITLSQAGHTFADPTNIKTGQKGVILINQDGTGGRTITTWGGKWKFSGGAKPTLSAAPGAADLISYTVLNANSIFCTFSAGFA